MFIVHMETEGGSYIAREQHSSLDQGAAVVSLGAVDMEGGVKVKMQVECGREEVTNGEKKTRRDGQRTDDQTLIMDDMKMV